MAKNLVQSGDVVTLTAPGTLVSGAGVLVAFVFGVVQIDVLVNDDMPIAVRGVWRLPKLSTDSPAEGAKLYWDDTNKRLTTTLTNNTYVAKCAQKGGAAASTTTVDALLNQA
jgi:predicted RecA/RadA family phage recombinase